MTLGCLRTTRCILASEIKWSRQVTPSRGPPYNCTRGWTLHSMCRIAINLGTSSRVEWHSRVPMTCWCVFNRALCHLWEHAQAIELVHCIFFKIMEWTFRPFAHQSYSQLLQCITQTKSVVHNEIKHTQQNKRPNRDTKRYKVSKIQSLSGHQAWLLRRVKYRGDCKWA
mgnify:CR=1 FL=1|jgi:hypothetical protein